jgi:hypothetical protein
MKKLNGRFITFVGEYAGEPGCPLRNRNPAAGYGVLLESVLAIRVRFGHLSLHG